MFEQVYPHIWMALPKNIRDHLVTVFNINKTGVSEIRDQELISDGHSIEDLKAITLEKMISYVGSTETFPRAWELSCSKANYELNPPMVLPTAEPEPIVTEESIVVAEETLKEASPEKGEILTHAETKKGK